MSQLTNPITLCFFLALLSHNYVKAQPDSISYVFQDAIENAVAANDDNAFEFDTEFESLQDFIRHPININKAAQSDFEQLKLLSTEQITAIVKHRNQQGLYFTLYELQSVLDLNTIQRILPFITVDNDLDDYQLPVNQWFKRGKNDVFVRSERRLEKSKGFLKPESGSNTEGVYLGDANKLYTRYRYSFGNKLSYGITMEKDAGERLNSRLDFVSFHFQINNMYKGLKALCLGDYSVSLGQGLIHENGFSLGKSAMVLSVEKNAPPIKRYSSSNEANFLRGAAAHFDLSRFLGGKQGNTEGVLFASYRQRDGNLIQPLTIDSSDNTLIISALQSVGYHRTRSEIEDKNAVNLLTLGGRILRTNKRGSIALNTVFNQFDKAIQPRDEPYNRHVFKGKNLLNISTDYKWTYQNVHLFGETALSDNLGYASLNGLLIGLDKRLSISILHRFFSLKYQALNAQPFSESSKINDESGVYLGLEYKLSKRFIVSAYADFWQHQWWRFRVDAPSNGHEYFIKSAFKFKNTEGYIQLKTKTKQENITRPDSSKVNQIMDKTKAQIRFHFQNKLTKHLTLRNRLELSSYQDEEQSKGFVIWQDIIWKGTLTAKRTDDPLSITSRLAFFDTDNYQSAIYAFENDLMYNFNVQPYYYRGTRFYVNVGYNFNKNMLLECRLARTHLTNKNTIGSGLDEIKGNHRTDVKMQVHFSF